jgi:hypothetical protein
MKKLLPPLLLLCLCACVDVPMGELPADASAARQPVEIPYKDLDPGYKSQETAHFSLKAYTSSSASLYASMCEDDYNRIMQDLGLYSFVPAKPYNVVVYKDSAEYHAKTGQPDWSGGATLGNALLLYEGDGLKATTAHEMTHLIFNEFMGLSQTSAAELRWLNEGVAVYEETRSSQVSASSYAARLANSVAANPIPFSQMVNLAPQNESQQNVDRWYAQVWSVAGFMISQGGSFNFSIFLGKLRDGAGMDKAIAETYTNGWKKLSDVESQWLLYVKK